MEGPTPKFRKYGFLIFSNEKVAFKYQNKFEDFFNGLEPLIIISINSYFTLKRVLINLRHPKQN